MAYLAVNKDGSEIICEWNLYRLSVYWSDTDNILEDPYYVDTTCNIPKGSIFKLIGKELTWEDEPVEI